MALSREEQVLQAILNDDRYKHFKEVGQDDWRDGTRTNASLSLSTKGWCDHKTGEVWQQLRLRSHAQHSLTRPPDPG